MRLKNSLTIALLTVLTMCTGFVSSASADELAFNVPPKPAASHIFDENRLMSAQQAKYFEELSDELYHKTGTRIAAALMDDIGEINAGGYAARLANSWQTGSKNDSNILLFVALKQRRRSVEIGSGITDAFSSVNVDKLQQELLIPAFRKEKYGEGILQLAYSLALAVASQKGVRLDIGPAAISDEEPMTIRGWVFIVAVAAFLVLSARSGKRFAGRNKPGNIKNNPWSSFGQNGQGKFGGGRW